MANEVKLPRLGQGMESGTIVRWLKGEGDAVEKGEPLYELDTDKVTQEVEAEASRRAAEDRRAVGRGAGRADGRGDRRAGRGGLDRRTRRAPRSAEASGAPSATGEEPRARPTRRADAGAVLSQLPQRRRTAAASRPRRSPAGSRASAASSWRRCAAPAPTGGSSPRTSSARAGSPATACRRRRACRRGRVRPADEHPQDDRAPPDRGVEVPAFQLTVSRRHDARNELVGALRELRPDVRVTVTDCWSRSARQALMRHPDVNVQFTDDALLRSRRANVGIAVAAPQGLVVPVIRSAERLSLAEIARARADLVGRARESKLQHGRPRGRHVHDLEPRHVRRRAVRRRPQPAAGGDPRRRCDRGHGPSRATASVVVRPMMTMTLTVDHRAVDGAAAPSSCGP